MDKPVRHKLRIENNAGDTFKVVGKGDVSLPLNQPVTVKVQAAPKSAGIKSAILELDDPRTEGVDKQIMTTVIVSTPVQYTFSASNTVQRNSTQHYFLTVPEGATALEVAIGGLKDKSQTRFISIHPYGVAVEDTGTPYCYSNYPNTNGCKPDARSYANPQAGVWEVEVESRRTSALLDNPYKLDVAVYSAVFDPATVTVPEAKVNTPVSASWTVTNKFAAIDGKLVEAAPSARPRRPARRSPKASSRPARSRCPRAPRPSTSPSATSPTRPPTSTRRSRTRRAPWSAAPPTVTRRRRSRSPRPPLGTYTVEVTGYSVPAGFHRIRLPGRVLLQRPGHRHRLRRAGQARHGRLGDRLRQRHRPGGRTGGP